jgi:predicted nucleotidyltransferase
MATITEQSLENEIQEILQGMGDALHGYKILLFGSRARGHAGPVSDFDVGVVGEQPLDLKTFYEIADALEALPTLFQVDWVDLNRASEKLRREALQNGRLLYEG